MTKTFYGLVHTDEPNELLSVWTSGEIDENFGAPCSVVFYELTRIANQPWLVESRATAERVAQQSGKDAVTMSPEAPHNPYGDSLQVVEVTLAF